MDLQTIDEFKNVAGDLRIVAPFDSLSWEIEFIRDDLQDEYSESDLEEAHRSIMANQVASDNFSEIGNFGDFDSQLYYFENVIVFQFPSERYEGVFVSYDRDDPFPVTDVIQIADQFLRKDPMTNK